MILLFTLLLNGVRGDATNLTPAFYPLRPYLLGRPIVPEDVRAKMVEVQLTTDFSIRDSLGRLRKAVAGIPSQPMIGCQFVENPFDGHNFHFFDNRGVSRLIPIASIYRMKCISKSVDKNRVSLAIRAFPAIEDTAKNYRKGKYKYYDILKHLDYERLSRLRYDDEEIEVLGTAYIKVTEGYQNGRNFRFMSLNVGDVVYANPMKAATKAKWTRAWWAVDEIALSDKYPFTEVSELSQWSPWSVSSRRSWESYPRQKLAASTP